ncbi:MAG: TrmH family RNA methyltransferase [Cyclobacteriaceae bacterium]
MVSKRKLKFIKSLQLKKYRKKEQCFLVEGTKSVLELLASDYQIQQLLVSPSFLEQHHIHMNGYNGDLTEVKAADLQGLGTLKSNQEALAVVVCKPNQPLELQTQEYALALDRIRDPGNLGTIIRIADWYGIDKVVCSTDCAELYNPKVIQATMGSFTRINTYYGNLVEYLDKNEHVYGACMDGIDVHDVEFERGGIIVIGNESQGIALALEPKINTRITIPKYGAAESLNAAAAAAVICDVLRGR